MSVRCPSCKPKFAATLPNYRLIFTGWSKEWKGGFASIKPFRGEKVAGAVYELSEVNLKQLDRNQGYPALYNRFNVVVWTVTKPSSELLSYIRQGYQDWDIE